MYLLLFYPENGHKMFRETCASSTIFESCIEATSEGGFTEKYMPAEIQESILDIDFTEHVRQGRTTLILGAESTFVECDGWDITPEIIYKLTQARNEGVEYVVITTNKRPKDETDLWQLQWWINQINADLAIVPLSKEEERTSSAGMLLKALQYYDVEPEQALMIGNKLVSDVVALNKVGMYSIWVEYLESVDNLGDRIVHRPVEQLIGRLIHNRNRISDFKEKKTSAGLLAAEDRAGIATKKKMSKLIDVPELIGIQGKIAGYGGPDIQLKPEYQALIPERTLDKVAMSVKTILSVMKSERFDTFMEEHGGLVADTATYARLGLGAVTCVSLMRGARKSAFTLYVLGQLTDVVDGWASRKSSEDPNSEHRKKMGRREANFDKIFAGMVGAALVVDGTKPWTTYGAQIARELTREPQRRYYDRKGLDTRATRSGKNGTAMLAIADGASILLGPGVTSSSLQWVATGGKWWSTYRSPSEWRYRKYKQEQAKRVEREMCSRMNQLQSNTGTI